MKKLIFEALLCFFMAIVIAVILGISFETAVKASVLFTVIWLSRYIPYEHPYGYKGDWHGYREGMVK